VWAYKIKNKCEEMEMWSKRNPEVVINHYGVHRVGDHIKECSERHADE
jgi:hypothetical protein